MDAEIWYAASCGVVLVMVIFISILCLKLQRSDFADNYGIQSEMSRSAHIIILLFAVAVGLYFLLDHYKYGQTAQESMITILMSIGLMSLTIVSTGGVIYIQDRQDRIYNKVQQKFAGIYPKSNGHDFNQNDFIQHPDPKIPNIPTIPTITPIRNGKESVHKAQYEQLKDPLEESQDLTSSLVMDQRQKSQYQAMAGSSPSQDISAVSAVTAMESPKSQRESKKRSNRSISKSIMEAEAQGRLELSHVLTNSKLLNVFAQFLCVEFNVCF